MELLELLDGDALVLDSLALVVVVEVGVLEVDGLDMLDVVVEEVGVVVVAEAAGAVVVEVLLTATLLTTEVAVVAAF